MSNLISSLRELQPVPGGRSRAPRFTEEEFRAIRAARTRGCSWKQIHELAGDRYKTVSALVAAFKKWEKAASGK